MKLIAQLKLNPTQEQHDSLLETIERANAACNAISEIAWETQTFRKYPLHKLVYHKIKKDFELSAQVVVRCIAKVNDAYKLDKKTKRTFNPRGSIAYDSRILKYYTEKRIVSIWVTIGREKMPFVCGENQRRMLETQQGESDLVYRDGHFYLHAVCNVDELPPDAAEKYIGVDFGVVNIAVDSDGEIHTAETVEKVRVKYGNLRAGLQRTGTKRARQKLKRMSGKEARFRKDRNHCISKTIVEKAKRTKRGISLEDLSGIRLGTRVRRSQRARHHTWSFHQLRSLIEYKAKLVGVIVAIVDPRNTSRKCSHCGHIDKKNRKSQDYFECTSCGYVGHADVNAAENLSALAVVVQP